MQASPHDMVFGLQGARMTPNDALGWISSCAFAICAIPQAYKAHKDGHSEGVSFGLLSLWLLGEGCGIFYGIGLRELPLIFNYGSNCLFVSIVFWYKIFPRRGK